MMGSLHRVGGTGDFTWRPCTRLTTRSGLTLLALLTLARGNAVQENPCSRSRRERSCGEGPAAEFRVGENASSTRFVDVSGHYHLELHHFTITEGLR